MLSFATKDGRKIKRRLNRLFIAEQKMIPSWKSQPMRKASIRLKSHRNYEYGQIDIVNSQSKTTVLFVWILMFTVDFSVAISSTSIASSSGRERMPAVHTADHRTWRINGIKYIVRNVGRGKKLSNTLSFWISLKTRVMLRKLFAIPAEK